MSTACATPPGSPEAGPGDPPLASSFPVINHKTPRARRRDALKEQQLAKKKENEKRRLAAQKRRIEMQGGCENQENSSGAGNSREGAKKPRHSYKPKVPQQTNQGGNQKNSAHRRANRGRGRRKNDATPSKERLAPTQEALAVKEKEWEIEKAIMQEKLNEMEENHTLALNTKEKLEEKLRAEIAALESINIDLEAKYEGVNRHLGDTQEEIVRLKLEIAAQQLTQRELRNTILELKGNIRVFARIRPTLGKEKPADTAFSFPQDDAEEQQLVLKCAPGAGVDGRATEGKVYDFKFDRVFRPRETQQGVFKEVSQLVQSALDGYKVCIFAYGQTGSGKTWTMEGDESAQGRGIIPRSVDHLFSRIEAQSEWKYEMSASFLEIYNETVRDLVPTQGLSPGTERPTLEVRFNPKTGETSVPGLNEASVPGRQDVLKIVRAANKARTVAATKSNESSSRSHSVFALNVVGTHTASGEVRRGVLNLIDLAGSERLASSKAKGKQLKETQAINKSLSSLGDVIFALASGSKHVPFRNSKLTFLLQNALGGNAKCLMLVNLSPASAAESLCSLRFGHKVNSCDIGTAKQQKR